MSEYKSEYVEEAENFLKAANATCEISYVGLAVNQLWNEDEKQRPMYNVTLTTPKGIYGFIFWGSFEEAELRGLKEKQLEKIANRQYGARYKDLTPFEQRKVKSRMQEKLDELRVNSYSVLACITKYDPGTFEDFCDEFGYDDDSIRAFKTYQAVQDEWDNLRRIFTPEQLEALQEIS